MARTGQITENPVSGERITFRKTAADTRGELLEIDLELTPDGHAPGLHVHPVQQERFEITKGTMRFTLNGKTNVARAGDVVVVPPGARHKFANGGDEPAHARVEIRPALQMEQLFETAIALAEDGRTNSKGLPKPLDLALFTREFRQETVGPFAPVWLQRLTLAPLAWLASRRGHGDRYAPEPATA
jgi:quercetin dioxygenase-like cupin family protein